MKLPDVLRIVISHLTNRGLRSWLTVLGIVVGVTAVVAIVSIGEGLQQSVTEQFSRFGVNTITITPGYSGASARSFRHGGGGGTISANLTDKDVMLLKTIPEVEYVNGIVSQRVDVTYLAETSSINLQGMDTKVWKFMTTAELASGRYLEQGDNNVAVVGDRIANALFSQPVQLNRQITIEGRNFKVVGILGPGPLGQEDSAIFVPQDAAREVVDDVDPDQLTSIVVQAYEEANMTELSENIEKKMLVSHQVTADKKDFTIMNPVGIQERMGEVTQTITLFLGGIAAISLLVGGIGIANTMYMSVMERTRQIGILKALGTTNWEVQEIFLLEAGLMGLIGGILGVLFGMIASGTITEVGFRLMGGRSVTTVIPLSLVIFALIFSTLIGMVAGILPARKAANLQPVEALRYE